MNSTENSFEVRILLKQLNEEVEFLQRAPEIAKIANCASNGLAYLIKGFSNSKIAENSWVSGFTTAASTAAGVVGGFIRPRYDDMARHSAVMVYGEIIEFNERGIERRDCEDAPLFTEHRIAGRTLKTREEFSQWLMDSQETYTPQTYKASIHNCHHFVKEVSNFLGVPLPQSVQIILDWLQNGGNSVLDFAEKLVGKCVHSSSTSSNPSPFVSLSTSGPPRANSNGHGRIS